MFGIIAGTGFTKELLEDSEESIAVKTPFGTACLRRIKMHGGEADAWFLARHGEDGNIPPHHINYRANIWALRSKLVDRIISLSAVGIITKDSESSPSLGALIVPDDIIDLGSRSHTYFDGDGGVVPFSAYVDMSKPYCLSLRSAILNIAAARRIPIVRSGTYVSTVGPRLETDAEIRIFRSWGGDVVGMTNGPESALARELAMCYSTIAVCANSCKAVNKNKSMGEVEKVVESQIQHMREIIGGVVEMLGHLRRSCSCVEALGRYPKLEDFLDKALRFRKQTSIIASVVS
jgi:5'-methylthioadenosine phosphorylase